MIDPTNGNTNQWASLRKLFLTLALCTFTLSLSGFFYNLRSTLSDYSWGDSTYANQLISNFLHHRPFQMSLYHNPGKGVIENPLPYAHQASVHVIFSPFLFVPLYALHPTESGMYALVIGLNCFSFLFFGYRWLRLHRVDHFEFRYSLLVFAVLCSSFLFYWQAKNHYLMFVTPFVLMANEAIYTRRKWIFLMAMLLWCLVQEDACMFALSFAVFIFFFEKNARSWAYWVLGGGFLYLLFASFVIQPAARWGMTIDQYTHSLEVLRNSSIQISTLLASIKVALPILLFLPAFYIVSLFRAGTSALPYRKALGMIVVAPLSHWLINIINPAEQHYVPNMVCAFIAFLYFLSDFHINPKAIIHRQRYRLIGTILVFVVANLVVMRRNIPVYSKISINEYLAHRTPIRLTMASLTKEEHDNKAFIAQVQKLPVERTMVYWTNRNVEGFFSNRPNLWRFPEYYDTSDLLVIQRGAQHTFYDVRDDPRRSVGEILKSGSFHSSGENIAIREDMVHRIVIQLVQNQHSHRIVTDTPECLVLARINPIPFPNQPETVGLGWLRNLQPLVKSWIHSYSH